MEAPRDDLVRALTHGVEIRADDTGGPGVLEGHFCVTGQWTRIQSWYEGDFYERIAAGAAAKTITEHFAAAQPKVKCLFDHGYDPQIGNKVLGPFEELAEDDVGVRYVVPLLETSYCRDLAPGLLAGLYGASFRFRVIQDAWNDAPGVSDHNPEGLPERTITEFALYEGGPVTFPAYEGATAGMRSLTDIFVERRLAGRPDDLAALRSERGLQPATAPAAGDPVTPEGADNSAPEPPEHSVRTTRPEALLRLDSLRRY